MRVTVTGTTGLIGRRLVAALRDRGDEVTELTRDRWETTSGPAPASELAGRDAVVHLAGAPVARRWTDEVRDEIRSSRVDGTRNLVAGLREADPRPGVLVCSSAVGYYGPRGEEVLTEGASPGDDFLAQVCVEWEREAQAASEVGLRVVNVRTGIVLAREGGALKQMLPPFKLGLGGPVAGGDQYMPWIDIDDIVGIYLAALDGDDWSGPVNACAPEPVTNKAFTRALGRALRRPAFVPVPSFVLRVAFGEMAEVIAEGQRAVPERATQLGYTFRHPGLDDALRAEVG